MYSGTTNRRRPPSMSATPPNGQTEGHDNYPRPPHPRRRRGSHLKALPCPGNVVGWHLAPPMMLPGHGSVFLRLSRPRHAFLSPPYDATRFHSRWGCIGCQNTRVVKNHPRVSCPLRPPSHSAVSGTNKGDPQPLHVAGIRRINTQTPPALPKSASALPGDVGDRSGAIMRPISTAPTPRESNGTPWGVSGHWGHKKCQNTRVVKNHPRVSCLLRPPSCSAGSGTNKDDPQPPHAAET